MVNLEHFALSEIKEVLKEKLWGMSKDTEANLKELIKSASILSITIKNYIDESYNRE